MRTPKKRLEQLFLAKRARRRSLARLPIEEKIEILIRLQQMAYDVGAAAGRIPQRPWSMGR